MRSDEPESFKFKHVCTYLPNIALLTKRATSREGQVMYTHTSIRNKSLRDTVSAFTLEELLGDLTVAKINAERAFNGAGKKIPSTNH